MLTDGASGERSRPSGPALSAWIWTMLADLGRLALLVLLSFVGGWGLNKVRLHPLPMVYRTPEERLRDGLRGLKPPHSLAPMTPQAAVAPRVIDLNEFQAFVSAHKGLVIDARADGFYRQGHVPGAVNLPRERFASEYARQKASLELQNRVDAVIYCTESDCPDSNMVADALAKLGFEHLLIYKAGWDEWASAGLPQEQSPVR